MKCQCCKASRIKISVGKITFILQAALKASVSRADYFVHIGLTISNQNNIEDTAVCVLAGLLKAFYHIPTHSPCLRYGIQTVTEKVPSYVPTP